MYNIGDRIVDEYKDITITDISYKYHNVKSQKKLKRYIIYKYICNKCGFNCGEHYICGELIEEKWVTLSELNRKNGYYCPCCSECGISIAPHINSIAAIHPHLIKFFKYTEDAYKYKSGSKIKLIFKCPDCETEKEMQICKFTKSGFICPVCSNKISIGERIMYSLLSNLNINFMKTLTKTTFSWCKNYLYDFYLKDINSIIEVNGSQHYKYGFESLSNVTLEDQIRIDNDKRNLAINNGITNYIIIDSSKTDFEYIKNSIIQSELFELLNINSKIINWDKIAEEVFCGNIIKDVCDYASNNDCTRNILAEKFHVCSATITHYLKIGEKLGWYKRENAMANRSTNVGTPIKINETNTYVKSSNLCSKISKKIFGKYVSFVAINNAIDDKSRIMNQLGITISYVTRKEFNEAITNGLTTYGSPFIL